MPEDLNTPAGSAAVPKPPLNAEAGVSMHLPFVSAYKDAWEIYREDDVTVQQLVAMRKTDGQAQALYRLITLPIRAALKNATFRAETGVEGGEKEAEFVEQLLTLPQAAGGMDVSFNKLIATMLTAVFDGFSAFELVYQIPKTGPLKGKITLAKAARRPAETLTFLTDDKGDFNGWRQKAMFNGRFVDAAIPKEHAIYYAANEAERPFYGISYFQAAFYHWDKKCKLMYIAHLAAQRAAVGTRVGTLPPGPSNVEANDFKRALADLGVAQYISVPEGYKVESLKEGGSFDFLAFINHHNSQMSKSVLAAFFDKDQGGGGDGKLVDFGQQSDAMFVLMLETIMSDIEYVINNTLIPRFIDWNFNSGKYPEFRFGPLSQQQKMMLRDTFDKLSTAGQSVMVTPEFVFELEKVMADEFGLEIDYEEIEKAKEEAKLAQEAQEKAQAALFGVGAPAAQGELPANSPPVEPSSAPTGAPKAIAGTPGKAKAPSGSLPPGFQLTYAAADDSMLSLTDLARELIGDALKELDS